MNHMVGFVCGGTGTIELVLTVAPSWRGQGLATRAVLLAAGWLIRERGAEVVQLRAGRDSPACQRIAVKSGFSLAGTVSSLVEATGKIVDDLRYITEADSATSDELTSPARTSPPRTGAGLGFAYG